MKKVSFKQKDKMQLLYICVCVCCVFKSRIFGAISLSFSLPLSLFLKSVSFFISLSLSSFLSLSLYNVISRSYFFYLPYCSCLALFLAFISLNFWAIMKDNSIAWLAFKRGSQWVK